MLLIDISEVKALTKAAERSLEEQQPREVRRVLDKAAAEERRTHVYNNYTHRLENSTFVLDLGPTQDGGFFFEFGARMEYASNVDARGRTRVRQYAAEAANEIDFYLDGDADRIGRM